MPFERGYINWHLCQQGREYPSPQYCPQNAIIGFGIRRRSGNFHVRVHGRQFPGQGLFLHPFPANCSCKLTCLHPALSSGLQQKSWPCRGRATTRTQKFTLDTAPSHGTGDSHKLNVRSLPHVLRMQSVVTPDWGRKEKGGLGYIWLVLAPHLATLDGLLSHLLCSYCRCAGKLDTEGVAGTLNLPLSLLSMPSLLVA